MDRNDPVLNRYIRSISDALPCSGKIKREVISQLRSSIVNYLQDNPEADFAAVQSHFGTPQEIAASDMYAQEPPTLLRNMSIKKKVFAIVAGVMAIILLIWIGVVSWGIVDARVMTEGRVGITIEED